MAARRPVATIRPAPQGRTVEQGTHRTYHSDRRLVVVDVDRRGGLTITARLETPQARRRDHVDGS